MDANTGGIRPGKTGHWLVPNLLMEPTPLPGKAQMVDYGLPNTMPIGVMRVTIITPGLVPMLTARQKLTLIKTSMVIP